MSDAPIRVEDCKDLAALVDVYELLPDRTYVVVCGDKKFDYERAHSLLKNVQEHHLNLFIIATTEPKKLKFMEPKDDSEQPIPGTEEAQQD